MYEIELDKLFKKQLKKLEKKHYPVDNVFLCTYAINENDSYIKQKIKDHALNGNWKGFRGFHPARYDNQSTNDDWIVIYKKDHKKLILTLVQTGNHDLY